MNRTLRTRILILLAQQEREDPSRYKDDSDLAEALGADRAEVQRQLENLDEQGLADLVKTFGGHSARITPRGRLVVEEVQERLSEQEPDDRRPIGF